MSARGVEIEPTVAVEPENAPLLGFADEPDRDHSEEEEEEGAQQIRSEHEYWDEFMSMARYAAPLILTNAMQVSLRLTSLLFVGRLGTLELGATALAQMTSSITGYSFLLGFATSLDTLCPEAFAAGKPQLVGLYVQRTWYMLVTMACFIATFWWFSEPLLGLVIPNKGLVSMTASLIRIYICALPGFATFEVGKRFIRSQGSAAPIFYFLILGVPLNIFLHWLFIFVCKWGVLGAAAAVSITNTFLPLIMLVYIYFSDAKKCWGGLTRRAFYNWGPVVSLAVPDLVMVMVDVLSWEILALMAAYLSDEELAAQTVLGTLMAITFMAPFSFSIAASFQVATAIGKKDVRSARVATTVALSVGCAIGALEVILFPLLRWQIPRPFTNDPKVVKVAAAVIPVLAAVKFFDTFSVVGNGVLRGLGRQKIGGIVMVVSYYAVGLPISVGTSFGLDWRLRGMWFGIFVAVLLASLFDIIAIWRLSYEKCVERSAKRTAYA